MIVEAGRKAFARKAWGDAFTQLTAASAEGNVAADDLELLAVAAYLTGHDAESDDAFARAYHAHLEKGDAERAASCAFWVGMMLFDRGEHARGGGWIGRAQRYVDETDDKTVLSGYLKVPAGLMAMPSDPAASDAAFLEALEVAEAFGDRDLATLARLGRGQASIRLGEMKRALAFFDEALVAVTAEEVGPIPAGIVYCAVIEACQAIYDHRRAKEWTHALNEWCARQPDLVPYRGQCLVHRAEVMQLHGAWPEAMEEADRARVRLSDPPSPAVGAAYYQLGELQRLRGAYAKAEAAYTEGSRWGRSPQPGLALLRLAQGRAEAASGTIRRELDEARDPVTRAKLLPAAVEILLAREEIAEARAAADELTALAMGRDAPVLTALADHARGAVLLAEGDGRGALETLRRAWAIWQDLEAPYEAARTRVLIGLACRALGDTDTAAMELDAACWAFRQLGATPAVAATERLTRKPAPAGGLTTREVQILTLVAAGKTNRAIAEELVISEKTVARHVANIFTKLGVGSRAAATAYAYEHDLV